MATKTYDATITVKSLIATINSLETLAKRLAESGQEDLASGVDVSVAVLQACYADKLANPTVSYEDKS